jgi:hypothetical protein
MDKIRRIVANKGNKPTIDSIREDAHVADRDIAVISEVGHHDERRELVNKAVDTIALAVISERSGVDVTKTIEKAKREIAPFINLDPARAATKADEIEAQIRESVEINLGPIVTR